PDPVFKKCVKESKINNNIMTIYYTEQCPFTDYYIGEIVKRAESIGFPLEIKKIQSKEEAQNAPSPYTTYSVFYNGQFLTHEILNEKKFDKLVEKIKMG
ncbi:MAG TPA: YoaP domain-containing protein, partial [Candidatus Hydrothermia bacterium]|nr:YoaP domain-containing protein [Candidatus Hydrothermia bacterium]